MSIHTLFNIYFIFILLIILKNFHSGVCTRKEIYKLNKKEKRLAKILETSMLENNLKVSTDAHAPHRTQRLETNQISVRFGT